MSHASAQTQLLGLHLQVWINHHCGMPTISFEAGLHKQVGHLGIATLPCLCKHREPVCTRCIGACILFPWQQIISLSFKAHHLMC